MNSAQIEEAIKRGFEARRNKDIETAKFEFQKAIDLGSAKAYCYLGSIYERIGNKDKAFELYQKAADAGEPLGYTYMGDYYDSLSMDYECDGNDEKAQECYKEAAVYYEKAHQGKEVKAMYNLANFYKIGQGVSLDKEKAFQLYDEIVQLKESVYHKYAYLELSRKYSLNNRFIDEEKCLELLYKSAALSCAAAYEELGKLTSGKGDVALANAYYKKAAKLHREQYNEYGAKKAEEKIVPCDIEVEPFIGTASNESPTENGDITIPNSGKTFMLINFEPVKSEIFSNIMKKQGFSLIGAYPDLTSADEAFEQNKPYVVFYNNIMAAEYCVKIEMMKKVSPSTRFIIVTSNLDLSDTSVSVDDWSQKKMMAVLISLAILSGASDYIALPVSSEDIINKVNTALNTDEVYWGFKKNDLPYAKEAFYWHGKRYYDEGKYSEAFEWIETAAKRGYTPAMHLLVVMYDGGLGVEKDREKAYYWVKKAGL